MKVILTENIEKVGAKGDVLNVKRGFARNYLIPRNFAIYATPLNLKKLDGLKQQYAVEENKRLEQMKQLSGQISALSLIFIRKVDEHENMYGSVSETDILHELQQRNIDIAKTAIIMEKHIKQLGDFEVKIHLHKDVNTVLHGVVQKEITEKEVEDIEPVKKAKEVKKVDEPAVEVAEVAVEPAVESVVVEEPVAEVESVAAAEETDPEEKESE
jgi:large subunit ribosomal protein L9